MRSTAAETARRIVADAFRLNWPGLDVGYALRCMAGVGFVLVVAALAGQPLAGASAAWGALVAGFASRQGVYRTRVGAMLSAALAVAASGYGGALTGTHLALNAVLLALWALVFGAVAALGGAATAVSVNSCVAFVLFSNPPYDTADPAFQAAMVLAGAAVQTLLLVVVWPLGGFRAERAALRRAYVALGTYAEGLRADDLGLPESETLAVVGAALADPQPFGRRAEIAAYQVLADEAERMRGTLAALATEQHLLADVGLGAPARALRDVGRAAAPVLSALATAIFSGREPPGPREALRAVDAALTDLRRSAGPHAPYLDDAQALAGQLRSALHAATAAAHGGLTVSADVPTPAAGARAAAVREGWERLVAACAPGSPYAKHAVRLAAAATVAVIVAHVVPLDHAQWIALTVILVLRPDFGTTFSRGVARVAGTVGGALLASLIVLLRPSDGAYVPLVVLFAGCSFALFSVSYALFSLSITGYVIYALAFGGASEGASALDRVVATAIGGVLALIAYAAWPTWTHARVGDALADLLAAQRRFAALVFVAYASAAAEEGAVRAAQIAVRRARAGAESAVDQMAAEPVAPRWLDERKAAGILAASRRFGIAALTLRARAERVSPTPHAVVGSLTEDIDRALDTLVDALRAGKRPAPLPPLRADQLALQQALDASGDRAIEVLVAETDLIVDSVNTIAAILNRENAPRVGTLTA